MFFSVLFAKLRNYLKIIGRILAFVIKICYNLIKIDRSFVCPPEGDEKVLRLVNFARVEEGLGSSLPRFRLYKKIYFFVEIIRRGTVVLLSETFLQSFKINGKIIYLTDSVTPRVSAWRIPAKGGYISTGIP